MMVRVVGFALGLVTTTATLAKAEEVREGLETAGIERVLPSRAIPGGEPSASSVADSEQLQVGGALELQQPGAAIKTATPLPRSDNRTSNRLAGPSADASAGLTDLAAGFLELRGSGLVVPVTERLALGVEYQHLQAANLIRTLALAGTLDYGSHALFLEAHWTF